LLRSSRLFAQSDDEAAVLQVVEALRNAMLDADRARLEELVADQLSYGHSSGTIQTKAQFVDVIVNKETIYKSRRRRCAVVREKRWAPRSCAMAIEWFHGIGRLEVALTEAERPRPHPMPRPVAVYKRKRCGR
jgi:hypothetical protein